VLASVGGIVGRVKATCESCGGLDDDLVAVHRLYVVPEAWDTPGSVTRVEEIERWCFPCRSMYPHEVAGERAGS